MTPKERQIENRGLVHKGIKRCSHCNKIKPVTEFASKGTRSKGACYPYCKDCAVIERQRIRSTFKGFSTTLLRGVKSRAKGSDLPYNLDIDYIESIWTGFDYYTGLPLKWDSRTKDGQASMEQASLDKLNPLEGYVKGNVQWVSKRTNMMKSDRTEEEFYEFCDIVLNYKIKREVG